MRRGFLAVAFALGVATLTGCGSKEVKLVTVSGKVTLTNGQTVSHGYVNLHPDESKGNKSKDLHQGQIKDGVFTIMTGAREGAPTGHYRVTIEAAKDVDPNNPYFTEWLADEKYVDLTRSGLTMEVVETPDPGRYDYKLDPPVPKKDGKKDGKKK